LDGLDPLIADIGQEGVERRYNLRTFADRRSDALHRTGPDRISVEQTVDKGPKSRLRMAPVRIIKKKTGNSWRPVG